MNRSERWLERRLNRWRAAVPGGDHNPGAIWLAQKRAMLIACAFGVPTLLCLWVYTLLYVRQNLFLLYLPLVLASVILSVTLQSLGQSISRRTSGLAPRSGNIQTRLLSWSVLIYTTLCLGYRAWVPDHFNDGLNLLVALLVVATGITVCAQFRPLRAGLTLALLTFVHSLPLLGGLRGHTLSGGPLLLGVGTELMLSTVLALMYSASWTQLALGQSEAVSVQMEYLSRTDHLTKLGNRRSLYSRIEALMAEMQADQAAQGRPAGGLPVAVGTVAGVTVAGGTVAGSTVAGSTADAPTLRAEDQDVADQNVAETFSVVLLDIDHFKTVNDTFGHASGDAVLCEVAEILESFMRRRDVAGRWGGEEFLLVIPSTTLDRAARIAERLRVRIESARMLPVPEFQAQVMKGQPLQESPGHTNHSVTASFGVACYQSGESLEALLARADAAMYRAKQGGRNRIEVAPPALPGAPSAETHPLPGGAADRLLDGPLGAEPPAPELTGTDG